MHSTLCALIKHRKRYGQGKVRYVHSSNIVSAMGKVKYVMCI